MGKDGRSIVRFTGSALDGVDVDVNGDVFTTMHPSTRWRDAIAEGERIRLGSSEYELLPL